MDRILALLRRKLLLLLADCHTHTRLSFDSEADPAGMAAAARRSGLSVICFTDHIDFLDGDGAFIGLERDGDKPFWLPSELAALSSDGLTVRTGVELGEPWEDPALAERVASLPELDFVIGSVHNLSSADGGQDFYYLHYEDEAFCHKALEGYFRCMEALSAMDCYDVLAHIIYPLRYMNGRDGNHVTLERYKPRLERIFRTVIAKDKGMEVNTCRGETVEDWRDILSLYRDCGGRIVTLGSDAHRPEDVGKGIPQAAELLRHFGFSPAVYEKRQPCLIRL